jgi:hypothetical protein
VASIESRDIASGELGRWFLYSAALTLIIRIRYNRPQPRHHHRVGGPLASALLLSRASHLLLSQRSPYAPLISPTFMTLGPVSRSLSFLFTNITTPSFASTFMKLCRKDVLRFDFEALETEKLCIGLFLFPTRPPQRALSGPTRDCEVGFTTSMGKTTYSVDFAPIFFVCRCAGGAGETGKKPLSMGVDRIDRRFLILTDVAAAY